MNKQLQANFLIVLVALFWGSTYFLTKMAVEELEPFNLTALRFGTAFIITALFFFKRIRNADRTVIKYSIILGVLAVIAVLSMTFGVQYTTASNAGFLISLSVVMIPLISVVVLKKKIKAKLLLSVILATIGIVCLTLNEQLTINKGDILCILCAASFAVQVLIMERIPKTADSVAIGALQLGITAVVNFILSFSLENFTVPRDFKVWGVIVILGVFCTAFCYIIQIYALKNTSAIQAGIILSLEPVFSAIFAYIFLGELLSKQGYIGAILLFISVILAGIV
ncbi:DMT family transporter [Fusobacterium sp.]|jgi:drug/metabolite transporter (DMT)-like permease|uniref:DMT family transporter n=1 Tax=Fusobacterium sp. TaxID=68766 RepID=UPI00261D045C|nr:DMT family transporter [Fusobacterium sp.]MEE1475118.1 DMT family transporter [Fusobacterium sp.]